MSKQTPKAGIKSPQDRPNPNKTIHMTGLKDLAGILVEHHGIESGFYEVSVQFQIGIGAVQGPTAAPMPGATIGIAAIGLAEMPVMREHGVDAAEIARRKSESKKGRQRK